MEEEVHGIKMKKSIENAPPSSEMKSILKCIYLITKSEDYESSYIGVCGEDKISGLLAKANLGKYVIELDSLDLLKRNNIKFPTNDEIRNELIKRKNEYPVCYLHEKLKNDAIPHCSRAKAEFIANLCYNIQVNEGHAPSKPV